MIADVTWRERLGIVSLALVPRLAAGALTFGSVDAIACFRNTIRILEGFPVAAPYLSGVELWIWIGSVLAVHAPVPVMLPHRLLAIACDALIALLLLESAPHRRRGVRRGILYAIAPIPIVISAIHTQWDSVWIYFLMLALVLVRIGRPAIDAAAGAAFVLSVTIKPIAAPLVFVLVPRTRARFAGFAAGAAATLAVYYSILASLGWLPDWNEFLGILHYARGGLRIFGLPYRPFDRFWATLVMVALLTVLHFAKRIGRDEVALLVLAFALGISGLSIQYLTWVVPFAILCDRTRFLAFYTLAAGVFVVFFYQSPVLNLLNTENLGAFALLKPFGAWAPPLPHPAMRPYLLFIGNVAVPLLCLGFVVMRIAALLRPQPIEEFTPRPRPILAPALVLLLAIGAATIAAVLLPPLDPAAFVGRIERKIGAYDVVRYFGPTMMDPGSKIWIARSIAEPGVANPILNISNLLLTWTVAAALVAGFWRTRES